MKYKCAICGKEYRQITHAHLQTHGLTRPEYRALYGDEGIFSAFRTSIPQSKFSEADIYVIERQRHINDRLRRNGKKLKDYNKV